MEKKIKIIIVSMILFLLVIALIIVSNPKLENDNSIKDENTYVCSFTQNVSDVDMITTYYVHYEMDNIKTIDINKIYKGNSSKAKDNIVNYRYIIGAETEQYSEYEGFSAVVNKDSKTEYNYTYTFDVSKLNDSLASLFGIYKTVGEQKEYFSSNNFVCE